MKGFLIALTLVLLSGYTVAASAAVDYPRPDEFKEYNVRGTNAYILKDLKTGCEYISRQAADSYVLREGSCSLPKSK